MVSATTVNYPKVATKDETAHSEQALLLLHLYLSLPILTFFSKSKIKQNDRRPALNLFAFSHLIQTSRVH
jgi:hypothetical protein